ncbi:fibrinogen-binding protein [Staphylococcus caeli]|uniref:Fibrinogen-binding protein n=1 Tax=Staphylococcus caeli TaxID=2201815 RepID=A0A1D4JDN3_9STAP|nr:fibrinogen-binding protein [Staphylococcus caeli]SCS41164.1 Extracellular fibrinogen-binding protein [Staphylococcus caeli]SCS59642.1 Extracellular fibrinogen-binding protein [Staphylococcus caeli]
MKNNYITKVVLSVALLGLTTTAVEAAVDAKQTTPVKYDTVQSLDAKVIEAKKAVNTFKKTRTIKTHRAAQKAVNKIHGHVSGHYAHEKQKLQKQINIVLKYNKLK